MGIDKDAAKFLLSARERKVNFQKTLMLGNQLFEVPRSDYKILTDTFKLKDLGRVKTSNDFFHLLGAEEVSAMDISDYEGATILHDLNQPIGDELKEKFTFVLDGGTLEHVFNFPNALSNAMKMVKVGGHLVIITGGNNFLGHGFYQFSPELFYRALSEENGFAVNRLVAAEVRGNWYEAADPQQIKGRVELINDKQVYLMVLAEKRASKPLFVNVPQQSDYVAMWHDTNDAQKNSGSSNKIKNLLKKNEFVYRTLVQIKQKQLDNALRKEKSFANSKVYKLVDK
ncbi:MAG: class I SAM-dependent methyltransferase [Acidobacteriota bacterium]|jgi:SAM-dependent methyltransferase|nr:class I SAM-dependent methyltransferase [Acidobacteriota bacterium]